MGRRESTKVTEVEVGRIKEEIISGARKSTKKVWETLPRSTLTPLMYPSHSYLPWVLLFLYR